MTIYFCLVANLQTLGVVTNLNEKSMINDQNMLQQKKLAHSVLKDEGKTIFK